MLNKVILTPVDELVEIVKESDNIAVNQLREKLKVPQEIIEKWLVILEENKVVRVKYKGFEGYVEFIEKDKKHTDNELDVERMKGLFVKKCRDRDMSYEKIRKIWPLFVEEHEEEIKSNFNKKGKKMGYENLKIEKAWLKYKEDLLKL